MKPLQISKENATFQVLLALKTNRRKRNELGEIFVEGVSAINHAVGAGLAVRRIIRSAGTRLSDWAAGLIAGHRHAQEIELSEELYSALSDRDEPSEILATFERPVHVDEAGDEMPLVVIVDRPSNHGNLGAIVRSANAFGVTEVIIVGHGVDEYDPAVIRASTGAVFRTPIRHLESLRELRELTESLRARYPGLRIVGTDSEGDTELSDATASVGAAIILIGNEAKGLSVQLKELADVIVRIPMRGAVDSLNVACAASIVMFALRHRGSDG